MTIRQRIRRPKAERIAEILSAAREIFAAKGYQAATLSDIASQVGVVEGAIYRHFKNKRDILLRLYEEFYEELIQGAQEELPAIAGCRKKMRYLIWRHLKLFADDPEYCWILIREVRSDPHLYQSSIHELNRRYTGLSVTVIEEGIAEGEIRSDVSPFTVRDLIFGGIEHMMWRHLLAERSIDIEARTDELTDMVFAGLAPSSSSAQAATSVYERLAKVADKLERASLTLAD